MTRRAVGLVLGIVIAVAAVAVAGLFAWRAGGDDIEPGTQAITVRRWVDPESQLFGDPVVATIDVIADSGRIDVDSISVETSFAPYDVVGEPERTRTVDGSLTRLRTRYRLQCLAQVCVPERAERGLTLEPAKITYLRADGEPGPERSVSWPRVTIASQLEEGIVPHDDATTAFASPFRARVQPPGEPSWRVSPWVAQIALLGGAVALVGVGALLLLPLVRRRPEPGPAAAPAFTIELTPLERALVGLDWARAAGGSRDQRKALELLAEELDADVETDLTPLADEARVLAWSARPPGDESTAALSDRVREIVAERAAALAARAEADEADASLAGAVEGNGRHA